jgi:hypothetical protein
MRFSIKRVRYMPPELQPGVLYISKEFSTAAHLCACGCGTKIRTPLGPTDWQVKTSRRGATLYPSIGNWQEPCQSHYIICDGEVIWMDRWTPEQIAAGRRGEERRSREYFESRARKGVFRRAWSWIGSRLRR